MPIRYREPATVRNGQEFLPTPLVQPYSQSFARYSFPILQGTDFTRRDLPEGRFWTVSGRSPTTQPSRVTPDWRPLAELLFEEPPGNLGRR